MVCRLAVVFGPRASYHSWSVRCVESFWLMCRTVEENKWWMIGLKNISFISGGGWVSFVDGGNLSVARIRAIAASMPIIVMARAVSLIVVGMVNWGVWAGSMKFEASSPVITLPMARRRMGLVVFGVSFTGFVVVSRLVFSRVK